MSIKFKLKLYVVGATDRSMAIVKNIKNMLNVDHANLYSLEVIDAVKQPKLAKNDNVLVMPTLIKTSPLPVVRIVGDLSDRGKVLAGLGLVVV